MLLTHIYVSTAHMLLYSTVIEWHSVSVSDAAFLASSACKTDVSIFTDQLRQGQALFGVLTEL